MLYDRLVRFQSHAMLADFGICLPWKYGEYPHKCSQQDSETVQLPVLFSSPEFSSLPRLPSMPFSEPLVL